MRRLPRITLLLTSALWACTGSRLPKELTFEGVRLDRATTWSRGEISGVVFVSPGEALPAARLQVGILVSREHTSGVELSRWVMEQYRSSPTLQWHESATADEACKIGVAADPPPRPFAALHVCRTGQGSAACAEADERLDEGTVSRCLNQSADCWDEVCFQMWSSRRPALEALVKGVLDGS